MTVEQALKMLLEMDQQWLDPRPSPMGEAAELLATLAEHAEPSLRDDSRFGDWRSIDLSVVRKRVTIR